MMQQPEPSVSVSPYLSFSSFLGTNSVFGFHFPALNSVGFFAEFFAGAFFAATSSVSPSALSFFLRLAVG